MVIKPIDNMVFELEKSFKDNPKLELMIKLELGNLVRKIYSESISQQTGWCMTFKVPEVAILNLLPKINIDQQKLKMNFMSQWKIPTNKNIHMVANPYYHILILFTVYGLKHRNKQLIDSSMTLLLCKIWNGRKQRHIPHCNPDVMRYVVANLSGKYWARKFDSPMLMIMNHYVPTLIKKYGDDINKDTDKTKRLFEQSWGRIRQIFISDMAPDIKTGKSIGRSGLSPLYFNAIKDGSSISTPKIRSSIGDNEIGSSIDDQYTSHSHEELIDNISNYIVMNVRPKYDQFFIQFVNRATTARPTQITLILNNMHSIKYSSYIRDILELMFKQIKYIDKSQICNQSFFTEVIKKKIISSKHSQTINQLKNITDLLLEKIFKDKIAYRDFTEYSNPQRGKLRQITFYGFGYNMQKHICSS
jgi:hypothetical protein